MASTNNHIALLVHSCDRYELLFKGFEFFFSQNWDFAAHCQYYFATEEKKVSVPHFTNILSGKGEWADRLAFLLREKIPEQYVLYVQEDMWFNKKIDASFLNRLFELARQNNWQQVKLHSSDVYKTTPTGIDIEGLAVTKLDNERSDFLMSHQITLWNKDFLLQQLHKKEHPWRNERKGTKRLKKLNPAIFQVDFFAENGSAAINQNSNPALRSEYQAVSINGTLNTNAAPFIQAMLQEKRLHDYAATLAYNLEHHLTHDGKPKPRKVDFFKRVKNWVRGV